MMKPPDPQARLQSWLQEWTLWQSMREDEPLETGRWAPSVDFSGEPAPAAGDVRLWPARDPRDPPFYGVLLPGSYGSWRVVPFSPFATPATPEELVVRDAPPLRVLQGWNRRSFTRQGAASAWKVDSLASESLWTLHAWITALASNGPPPAQLLHNTGPPLCHPLDPRHVYLDEEFERTERALGEFLVPSEAPFPQQHAAEPESKWGDGKTDA